MVALFNGAGSTVPASSPAWATYAATVAGQLVRGSGNADCLQDVAGGDILQGGSGDDTYKVGDGTTQILEDSGGGIDTISTKMNYTLPTNVENLVVDQWNLTLHGNAADNLFTLFGGSHRVYGETGNDVIDATNSVGANIYAFAPGSGVDAIYGFNLSIEQHDFIQLETGFGLSCYADILNHMTQVGPDVVIQLSATDSITLRSVQEYELSSQNFLLPLDVTLLHPTFQEDFSNSLRFYDPSNGGNIGWKTNYAFGAQYGTYDYTSRTEGSELQIYTDPTYKGTANQSLDLNPFSIQDGVLTIKASKVGPATAAALDGHDWSSGLLTTEKSFAQTYGYFEISAKLPAGNGMWPAFWLLPEQGDGHTELDVFEQTGGSTVIQTVHNADGTQRVFTSEIPTATTQFHTYGVLWTADTITYYIDGLATGSMRTPDSMHQPMYMLTNLAVSGGGWAGMVDPSVSSGQMTVDYIHAYSLLDISAGNYFIGSASADVLTGTSGADTLTGGTGNDVYTVDNVGDVVVEKPGEGTDLVNSFVSYTAPSNVENVTLLGLQNLNATGNDLDNILTGNDGQNVLTGGSGNDTLIGGADKDILIGGRGNDTYIITSWYEDGTDTIIENPGEGIDTVRSAIDFTLPDNTENLILTGSDASAGHGNSLDNMVVGNGANNVIDGGKGNDILTGGGGADTFVFAPGSGRDMITDFSEGDHLDLSAYLSAGVSLVLSQDAGETVISFSTGDSIHLISVNLSSMKATASGYDLSSSDQGVGSALAASSDSAPSAASSTMNVSTAVAFPMQSPSGDITLSSLAASAPDAFSSAASSAMRKVVAAYRFYDTITNDHFYTTDATEAASIKADLPTLTYEGAPWTTPNESVSIQDVFRFFDTVTKTHFLTQDANEVASIKALMPTFIYEGVAFEAYTSADASGAVTLERFYNTSSHVHTYALPDEAAEILAGGSGAGWVDEGHSFIVHMP